MKRAILLLAVLAIALPSAAIRAVDFGPLTVGVHLIPAVEASEEGRSWDMSLSLGIGLTLDASNRFEIFALTDSRLTSLGFTAAYFGGISDRFTAGVGLTALWPLGEGQRLLRPVIEAFAHGSTEFDLGPIFRGSVGFSFSFAAVAHRLEGWEMIALAELPSLALRGDVDLEEDNVFRGQLTLQPVVTDTTSLERPIGRVNDNLLVLPTVSGFLRFLP
jgi:hypothetical protein